MNYLPVKFADVIGLLKDFLLIYQPKTEQSD